MSLYSLIAQPSEIHIDSTVVNMYNHQYEVELIPQTTGVSCWASSIAMIVGWRDWVVLNPQEIAEGVGYWAQYNNESYRVDTTLAADDLNAFEAWSLVPDTRLTFSLEEIARLLWEYGPIWVASDEALTGEGSNHGHVRVIKGISGDGTPEGTLLMINDPWDRNSRRFRTPNTGSQYSETYAEFISKMQHLIQRERNQDAIYLARL